MENYVKRIFVNDETSSSTGSVCAFDGYKQKDRDQRATFIEFGDCTSKVRIRRNQVETKYDFIDKILIIKHTLSNFVKYLNGHRDYTGQYNQRHQLCGESFCGTESIVAFDGEHEKYHPIQRRTFVEISDINNKIRYHKVNGDTIDQVIEKFEKIVYFIDEFVEYLKNAPN